MLSVTKCQSSKCVLESTTTHACGAAYPGAGVLMLNPDALWVVYKQENTCMIHGTVMNDTKEKKLLNKVVIFVFFAHKKCSFTTCG